MKRQAAPFEGEKAPGELRGQWQRLWLTINAWKPLQ
jgi:hypothetical protein